MAARPTNVLICPMTRTAKHRSIAADKLAHRARELVNAAPKQRFCRPTLTPYQLLCEFRCCVLSINSEPDQISICVLIWYHWTACPDAAVGSAAANMDGLRGVATGAGGYKPRARQTFTCHVIAVMNFSYSLSAHEHPMARRGWGRPGINVLNNCRPTFTTAKGRASDLLLTARQWLGLGVDGIKLPRAHARRKNGDM